MKAIQAVVLVLVGVVGTIVFVKVNRGPEPTTPVAAPAPESTVAPVSKVEPVPEPAPAAVRPEKKPVRIAPKATPPAKNLEPPMIASNTKPAEPPREAPVVAPPAPVAEPAPKPVEPPPPPPLRKVTLDVGTTLSVRLIESLSSDRNHPGDTFTASLDEPLVADGMVIAEKG